MFPCQVNDSLTVRFVLAKYVQLFSTRIGLLLTDSVRRPSSPECEIFVVRRPTGVSPVLVPGHVTHSGLKTATLTLETKIFQNELDLRDQKC